VNSEDVIRARGYCEVSGGYFYAAVAPKSLMGFLPIWLYRLNYSYLTNVTIADLY